MNAFVTAAGGVLAQPRVSRTSSTCAIRMNFRPSPRPGGGGGGSGGINAGEEYIRQLARQSAENHERRFGNGSVVSDNEPVSGGYQYGAHNAGEEYMRQLANQSAGRSPPSPPTPSPPPTRAAEKTASPTPPAGASQLTPEQQERMAAMRAASAAASRGDTPAKRVVDGAEAARQRILAELDALNLETENINVPPEVESQQPAAMPNIISLDDEIAALEAKLAARQSSVSAEPAPIPNQVRTSQEDKTEIEQLRMGMIEMRMETERYANEVRKLHEKHEQIMRVIIEKYMPGL